jgi:hypothetical protein
LAGQLREGRTSESRRDNGRKAQTAQGQLKLHLALLELSKKSGSAAAGDSTATAPVQPAMFACHSRSIIANFGLGSPPRNGDKRRAVASVLDLARQGQILIRAVAHSSKVRGRCPALLAKAVRREEAAQK